MLEGLLLRRVRLGVRDGTEIIGPGDVLRPWVTYGEDSELALDATWRVEHRARLAILDRRCALRVARWPEVAAALMDRLVRRQRFLAMHLAILSEPRLQAVSGCCCGTSPSAGAA